MKRQTPCPFCGFRIISLIQLRDKEGHKQFFSECQTCKAHGPVGFTSKQAVEAWNKIDYTDERGAK